MSLPHLAPVFALLLASAIKGSVVLLAALAAVRLMRRRSAASRHLVWVVALASLLALPVAMRLVPGWRVMPLPSPLRPAASYLETTVPAGVPAVVPQTRTPGAPSTVADGAKTSPGASPRVSTPTMDVTSTANVPSTGSVAAEAAVPAFDWTVLLAGVWAAGGLLLALRLAYGVVRVWWMERRAVEITEESWVHVADGLARRLRVGRMVTLLRESHAVVPMTWGIVHPVVLLPADAEGWDHERRTVVLAHELAHVRRWDTATQWIAHLAVAVFWFHPLVWLAVREMREERERACDDAVLSIGTRPAEYADHLLDIVRSLGSSEGPAAALAMARRSQFEGRLLAILDGATSRGGVSRGLGLAALAAACTAVVPLAALRAAEVAEAPAAERTAARLPAAASPAEAKDAPIAAAEHPLAAIGAGVKRMVGAAANAFQSADSPRIPPAALPASPASAASAASAGSGASSPAPTPASVPEVSPVPAASGNDLKAVSSALGVPVERAAAMLRPGGGYADVIRAAAGIASSPEKAEVLMAVLRRPDVGSDDLAALLRVTEGFADAPERRDVLKAVATRYSLSNATVRREFFAAVSGFAVCPERRDVLLAVLTHDPDAATVSGVIDSAREMAAEAERRDVLSKVIDFPGLTASGVRQAVGAVREITGNAVRRDLLVKVLGRQNLTSAELRLVFTATAELPSSPEQRDVLVYAAGHQRLDGSAREAYVAAAGVIASSAERAEALSALLGDRKADAAPSSPAPSRSRPAAQADAGHERGLWSSDLVIDRNNGERVVRIRSRHVERSADGGIRSIRPGGYLTAEEITHGQTRRVEMSPDGAGIHRTYRVNGVAARWEGEGSRWLAALLREFTGS